MPGNAGDIRYAGFIPESGRSPAGGHGNPLQYSCLENPIDSVDWWAIVHRIAKNQTQLKWLSTLAHKLLSRMLASQRLLDDLWFLTIDLYVSSLIAQLVKSTPAMQETLVQFLGQEDSRKRDRLPTSVFLGFPGDSAGKESTCNAGDLGSIPELGRYPGEGKGYPLQSSGLENSVDYIVHWVAKSQTWLNDLHLTDPKVMEIYDLSDK